jgi:TRAP-type mannitol/chloroaromatic compound transport system permease small subunit
MQKILRLQKVLADVFGLLVLVLMFLIVVEVGGRFIFNTPLKGGVEASQILLTWVLFLPLAYALVQNAHVRVTMVVTHLSTRVSLIIEALGTLLSLAFFGLVTYVAWLRFCDSFSVGEVLPAAFWIPLWFQKLALPVGFFLFFLQLCINMVGHITKLRCTNGH